LSVKASSRTACGFERMASTQIREQIIRKARKLVIKLGTHVLTDERGQLHSRRVGSICRQVAKLAAGGRQVTVVSSGAIGAGMGVLAMSGRPKHLHVLQAAASVGQGKLMQHYEKGLGRYGLHAAQIMVTRSDFEDRRRYLNIRHTIDALSRLRAVAIINENDTVAVDEIRFGDNDLIAAMVANLLKADLLILLTVVDGLYRQGRLVDLVDQIDGTVRSWVDGGRTALGSGGMRSKLQAVRLATDAGVPVLIANGGQRDVLLRIVEGRKVGTVFAASKRALSAKRRWIGMTVRPSGQIVVDEGAAGAIVQRGRSLLPSGIVSVIGRFGRGQVVAVIDQQGSELARGITAYDADELEKIKGLKTTKIEAALGYKLADEVIHRNNMVVVGG